LTDTPAHGHKLCSLPRDQYTCIVFHDKRSRTARRDVLIPLAEFSPLCFLSLSLAFSHAPSASRCDFRFRPANQPPSTTTTKTTKTTRHDYRNGFNKSRTFNRSCGNRAGNSWQLSAASRKGESSRDSPRGISDVAIGAGHESFMRQSFLVPCLPGYLRASSPSPSLFPFFPLPQRAATFRYSLWKSGTGAASYQSAESVNRHGNVFQPTPTRRDSYSCLILLVFCSFRTFIGLDPRSDYALLGESKFNGIHAQSRSRPFLSI